MPTRSARAAVPALAAALLLGGCGSSTGSSGAAGPAATPTAVTFEPGAVEALPFVPTGGQAPAGDGQPLAGRLVTPHTAQQLTTVQVTDQLSEDDALVAQGRSGLDAPTAAPEGYELVVVSLSTEGLQPPYLPGDTPAGTSVVVDGTATPVEPFGTWSDTLDDWTTPVSSFVVVAPVDTAVLLQVTDEGRTATLDLRTGARADDEGTRSGDAWYRATRAPVSGTASATGDLTASSGGVRTLAMTASVSLDDRSLQLNPWHPTYGWAAPGRTWGTVRATVERNTVQLTGFTADPGRVFTLTGPDGVVVPPQPEQLALGSDDGQYAPATVAATWDLPADLADGGTLAVVLDVDWDVLGSPASWAADDPALPPVVLAFV